MFSEVILQPQTLRKGEGKGRPWATSVLVGRAGWLQGIAPTWAQRGTHPHSMVLLLPGAAAAPGKCESPWCSNRSCPTETGCLSWAPLAASQTNAKGGGGYFSSLSNFFHQFRTFTPVESCFTAQGGPWKTTRLFLKKDMKVWTNWWRRWYEIMLHFTAEGCFTAEQRPMPWASRGLHCSAFHQS